MRDDYSSRLSWGEFQATARRRFSLEAERIAGTDAQAGEDSMPACGSCGYSGIDVSALYCPRCGEAFGGSEAVEVVRVAEAAEPQPPIDKTESSNEVKEEKAASWESEPDAENAPGQGQSQETVSFSFHGAAPKIGGWLYIPPVILAFMIYDSLSRLFKYLNPNDFMKSLFAKSDYFSIYYPASAIFFFALTLFALISFFRKKKYAPLLFLVVLWVGLADIIVYVFWLSYLFDDTTLLISNLFVQISMAVYLTIAIVSTIAFRRSKRAKATFVN